MNDLLIHYDLDKKRYLFYAVAPEHTVELRSKQQRSTPHAIEYFRSLTPDEGQAKVTSNVRRHTRHSSVPAAGVKLPKIPEGFAQPLAFDGIHWSKVPDAPGVYLIYETDELLYVGMAGREGKGSLRRRLKDHASGQVVNMFAQYLFLARAQFTVKERVTHPNEAKSLCQKYIQQRCVLSWRALGTSAEARALEAELKVQLKPALNGSSKK